VKPLVSILIPTCDRPHYLEQALKSALDQTYPRMEIVICDNSEDDASERMVKAYQSKRKGHKIRYFRNSENLGPIINQQKCLELSKGKYVNYLMDDDLFHPVKIEKMMHYFLKYKEVSLVTSQRRIIDGDGHPIYVPPVGTFRKLYDKDTIVDGRKLSERMLRDRTNYIGEPTTVLFRKKDLTEPFGVLSGQQIYFGVDLASWLNLLTRGKAVYMVQPLSYLRYHSQQLSKNEFAKQIAQLDKEVIASFAKSQGYRVPDKGK